MPDKQYTNSKHSPQGNILGGCAHKLLYTGLLINNFKTYLWDLYFNLKAVKYIEIMQ